MKYANDQEAYLEQLSALADGELDTLQVQTLVGASKSDAELMHAWASYHAIGDALRAHASDAHTAKARDSQVTAAPMAVMATMASERVSHSAVSQPAANDSVWRWKLVAGVAALAAVGSVLWSIAGQQGGPAGAQLAQRSNSAPAIVAGAQEVASQVVAAQGSAAQEGPSVMLRDPRLDELLAAHKQFGGASALQQPAGFLRNATFTPTGR